VLGLKDSRDWWHTVMLEDPLDHFPMPLRVVGPGRVVAPTHRRSQQHPEREDGKLDLPTCKPTQGPLCVGAGANQIGSCQRRHPFEVTDARIAPAMASDVQSRLECPTQIVQSILTFVILFSRSGGRSVVEGSFEHAIDELELLTERKKLYLVLVEEHVGTC
jgi:hypothetical protein